MGFLFIQFPPLEGVPKGRGRKIFSFVIARINLGGGYKDLIGF